LGVLPTTNAERALGKVFMSAGPFWHSGKASKTMARFGLNMLDPSEQHRVSDRLGPESGRVMFQLFFWMFDENRATRIEYDKVTCRVLMVSGSRIWPSPLQRLD
jgi:non-heme chloroperoxidase